MKFTLDAHLPKSLERWIIEEGYDCNHTLDLPEGNDTQDESIIKYVDSEDRILISKDTDFYNSNLLRGKPRRVLLITAGNISNKNLLKMFEANFKRMIFFFDKGSEIVEINNNSIYIHK